MSAVPKADLCAQRTRWRAAAVRDPPLEIVSRGLHAYGSALGRFVYRFPWAGILLGFLVCALPCIGFIWMPDSVDNLVAWLPRNSSMPFDMAVEMAANEIIDAPISIYLGTSTSTPTVRAALPTDNLLTVAGFSLLLDALDTVRNYAPAIPFYQCSDTNCSSKGAESTQTFAFGQHIRWLGPPALSALGPAPALDPVSQSYMFSPLCVINFDRSRLASMTDEDVVRAVNTAIYAAGAGATDAEDIAANASVGGFCDPLSYLGDLSYDENGSVIAAGYAQTVVPLGYNPQPGYEPTQSLGSISKPERLFLFAYFNHVGYSIRYPTAKLLWDQGVSIDAYIRSPTKAKDCKLAELRGTVVYCPKIGVNDDMQQLYHDLYFLGVGVSIALVASVVMLTRCRKPFFVNSRIGALLFGLLCIGAAVGGGCLALPACLQLGLSTIAVVSPFLVVSLGLDDLFILITGTRNATDNMLATMLPGEPGFKELHQRCFVEAYAHGVTAILLTKSTSMASFIVGAISAIPAITLFGTQAAGGLFFLYFSVALAFGGFLAYDEQRYIQQRYDFCCCRRAPPLAAAPAPPLPAGPPSPQPTVTTAESEHILNNEDAADTAPVQPAAPREPLASVHAPAEVAREVFTCTSDGANNVECRMQPRCPPQPQPRLQVPQAQAPVSVRKLCIDGHEIVMMPGESAQEAFNRYFGTPAQPQGQPQGQVLRSEQSVANTAFVPHPHARSRPSSAPPSAPAAAPGHSGTVERLSIAADGDVLSALADAGTSDLEMIDEEVAEDEAGERVGRVDSGKFRVTQISLMSIYAFLFSTYTGAVITSILGLAVLGFFAYVAAVGLRYETRWDFYRAVGTSTHTGLLQQRAAQGFYVADFIVGAPNLKVLLDAITSISKPETAFAGMIPSELLSMPSLDSLLASVMPQIAEKPALRHAALNVLEAYNKRFGDNPLTAVNDHWLQRLYLENGCDLTSTTCAAVDASTAAFRRALRRLLDQPYSHSRHWLDMLVTKGINENQLSILLARGRVRLPASFNGDDMEYLREAVTSAGIGELVPGLRTFFMDRGDSYELFRVETDMSLAKSTWRGLFFSALAIFVLNFILLASLNVALLAVLGCAAVFVSTIGMITLLGDTLDIMGACACIVGGGFAVDMIVHIAFGVEELFREERRAVLTEARDRGAGMARRRSVQKELAADWFGDEQAAERARQAVARPLPPPAPPVVSRPALVEARETVIAAGAGPILRKVKPGARQFLFLTFSQLGSPLFSGWLTTILVICSLGFGRSVLLAVVFKVVSIILLTALFHSFFTAPGIVTLVVAVRLRLLQRKERKIEQTAASATEMI